MPPLVDAGLPRTHRQRGALRAAPPQVLEETTQDELDDLAEQLSAAQAQVAELQRTVKQLQAAAAQ